jgi:DNA polymerase-3 subunit epsilon
MQSWLTSFFTPRLNGALTRSAPLDSLRYVVVDTELTSLDRRTNRLLSVGAIAMEGSKIRINEQFYRVVNPSVEIPAETIVVHGLRPIDIEQGSSPEEVLQSFDEFIRDAVLVGHFASIDKDVLRKEFRSIGMKLANPVIDTASAYHWLELHQARLRGLDEAGTERDLYSIAKRYSLDVIQAHHALSDGFLTAQLWQRLLVDLESSGVRTLGAILRFARS